MKEEHDEMKPFHRDDSRRQFLKKVAASAASVTLLGALAGCTPDEPEMLVGTMEELKKKGTLSPKFNGSRIFATFRKEEVVVFSLICQHKACTVKWKEKKDKFDCPCHKSSYDREGNVLSGPSYGPLRRFEYEIRGKELWVLNKYES